MTTRLLLKILFFGKIFFATQLSAQNKVVGYFPLNRIIRKADLDRIAFNKLTHLNLAFINPDSSGQFRLVPEIDSIVLKAHDNSVKVLASIGGGSAPVYFANLLNDQKRGLLIANLVRITVEHQLDGIDVDLEGNAIDQHYEVFLRELSAALRKEHKLMTAALATAYGPIVTDRALGYLDFINIMSYDKTGPWTKGHPGPHAPYEMAVSDLVYWTGTRKISRKKIILGVPFYGYLFGKDAVNAMPFSEIVTKFPGSEQEDSLVLKDGGLLYYNGLPTTRQKTRLAMKKAGGIMFWQLLQDAEGTLSLLNAIDETNGLSKRKR